MNAATDRMIRIPGTTCLALANKSRRAPGWWSYFLYDECDERGAMLGSASGVRLLAADAINLAGLSVTPEQVARIAFILEVDHA